MPRSARTPKAIASRGSRSTPPARGRRVGRWHGGRGPSDRRVVVPSTRRVRGRIVAGSLLFIAGFTVIFTLVSVVAASVGADADPLRATPCEIVVGALVIVLGRRVPRPDPGPATRGPDPQAAGRRPRRRAGARGRLRAQSWTPCISPDARCGARVVGDRRADRPGRDARQSPTASASGSRSSPSGSGFRRLLGVFAVIRRNSQWVTRDRRRAADRHRHRDGDRRVDRLHQLAAGDRRHRFGEHLMTDVQQQRSDRTRPRRRRRRLDRDPGPRAGVGAARRRCRRSGSGVVRTAVVARSDQHAYRVDAAVPAGHRGDPGLAAAAGEPERRQGHGLPAGPPDDRRRCSTASARSMSSPRSGSPRSTCCCSSRWWAACCRGCGPPHRDASGCRRTRRRACTGCRCRRRRWRFAGSPAEAAARLRTLLKARRYRTVVRSHADGIGDGLGREGLHQGDRQPAVPLLAAGAADRRRVRIVVRLARRPAAGGRQRTRLLQRRHAARRPTASARG